MKKLQNSAIYMVRIATLDMYLNILIFKVIWKYGICMHILVVIIFTHGVRTSVRPFENQNTLQKVQFRF